MPAGKACWKHKTQCAVHVGNSWLGRENDVANWCAWLASQPRKVPQWREQHGR